MNLFISYDVYDVTIKYDKDVSAPLSKQRSDRRSHTQQPTALHRKTLY
jgi:hypothetical protein